MVKYHENIKIAQKKVAKYTISANIKLHLRDGQKANGNYNDISNNTYNLTYIKTTDAKSYESS